MLDPNQVHILCEEAELLSQQTNKYSKIERQVFLSLAQIADHVYRILGQEPPKNGAAEDRTVHVFKTVEGMQVTYGSQIDPWEVDPDDVLALLLGKTVVLDDPETMTLPVALIYRLNDESLEQKVIEWLRDAQHRQK